jgi:hypothetical protein
MVAETIRQMILDSEARAEKRRAKAPGWWMVLPCGPEV